MKIFGWMQSKLNAKQGTKKPNAVSAIHHMPKSTCKEEFSDWPQALLAIGTFGNSNLRAASCQNHTQNITPEEVGELQKALNSFVDLGDDESEVHNLPSETVCEDSLDKDAPLNRNASVVFTRGKDIFSDNTNNVIRKKSLSFLLKKMFSGKSGFTPASLVRDSLPESTMEKSRMEKIFMAILNKKIYPQSCTTPKAMPKKYLERNDMSMSDSEDEMEMDDKDNDGSKWVKTDSEYIVLEI